MTYTLFLGDPAYSSWSLRAWLLFDRFDISVRVRWVDFNAGGVADQLAHVAPARTVPALQLPSGPTIADSLAIAEEVATRHPDKSLWPTDETRRAMARTITAEMHSGFGALRSECPMNLYTSYADVVPSSETRADIDRIVELWDWARQTCAPDGPWLCGDYSIADAAFAPVAARIAGYGLEVPPGAAAYVAAHLADPAFRRWRALGLARGVVLPRYTRDHRTVPWPGPAPLAAAPTDVGPPENAACPYSGRPTSHNLDIDGRIFGFCNATCRDKTVADPEVWPRFMSIYRN